MKSKDFKIFEYEEKGLSEEGRPIFTKKELKQLELLNLKIRKSQKLPSDILEIIYFNRKPIKIRSFSYVGVLKTRTKSIQIIPKMARSSSSEESYVKQAVKNLLFMLNYTNKLGVQTDISSVKKVNDDFFEVLIFLFCSNLMDIIKKNFYKEYIEKEENLFYLKGKLHFNQHIKQNIVSKNRFYLLFDEFNEDNLLNQILKYTVHVLMQTTKNINNFKLLRELNFIFSDISLRKINISDFERVIVSRLNKEFDPILNLARLFLTSGSIELSRGRIDTFSFVINMNQLFEEFIGEFIKKELQHLLGKVVLQDRDKYLVEDKIIKNEHYGKLFQMRPDITIYGEEGIAKVIIDTKYKLLNNEDKKEGVSQQDLYQMSAYSKKFRCKNIILLYPKKEDDIFVETDLLIDKNCIVHVRSIDLCRDIKEEKEDLKKDLLNVIQGGLYNLYSYL